MLPLILILSVTFFGRKLGGKTAPDDWQGKLPFTYKLGPELISPDV
jgi:hypothetical protein